MRTLTQDEVEQLAGGVELTQAQQIRGVVLGVGMGALFSVAVLETQINGTLIGAVVGGIMSYWFFNSDYV